MLGCKKKVIQITECESFGDYLANRNHSFGYFYIKINCRPNPDKEIDKCNPIADYYEKGAHYIRRDLLTDDGTIDYKKLLEDTKPENSECYPANHEVK
jgi:hypothetical protein